MRARVTVVLLAAVCGVARASVAQEAEPVEEGEPVEEVEQAEQAGPVEEDPDVVLSYDSWFIRLDAGLAYTRAQTRYEPSGGGNKDSIEVWGLGPSVQLAIAARLGRDVTLGGLGRLAHAPATRQGGDWEANRQGLYYAAAFVDHRLPAKILRLGGGVGGGYMYTMGPDEERFGALGPIGTIWLGLDFASSSRVALGVVLDVTGGAMADSHQLEGKLHDFDTFMMAVGISFTIRISEPSWPDSMPALARSEVASRI